MTTESATQKVAKKSTAINGVDKKEVSVTLPEINVQKAVFKIKGVTPLIVNKFSEKAKKQMLDKQTKKASKGREAKVPKEQYLGSLYMFKNGKKTGFPAVGLKAAMVRASKQLNMAMTDTRGMFHVLADEGDLIEIKGKHQMREDMVRVANGAADIRFRGEYPEWQMDVTISYNSTVVSYEQLASILQQAGFSCGLGEWRPEKSNSGSYGLFELQ